MAAGIGSSTLEAMIAAGLTPEQMLSIVRGMEADAKPKDNTAAERQARCRARKRGEDVSRRDVTRDPLNDTILNPTDSPTEAKASVTPRGKTDRGTRLPDDFQVPGEWIDYSTVKRHWSRAEGLEEAQAFCRYWQAKPGAGARKRDWFMTWQNWVANSRRPNGTTPAPRTGPAQPVDPLAAAQAKEKLAETYDRLGQTFEADEKRKEARRLRASVPIGDIAGRIAQQAGAH